jgi:hypothetical protein
MPFSTINNNNRRTSFGIQDPELEDGP